VLNTLRVDLPSVWPDAWLAWAQVLLAGAVMDLGLYLMHRASHRFGWLWRLHAPHHSSERLYWLNGERRHPLSAMLLAGPGLLTVIALGAPPVMVSAWLTLLAVHLAFQHANLDYRMGPLRYMLGVAEIHRWHHKREYEDAQVNFGEFWMLWDHLGRTFHDQPNGVVAGEVGLRDRTFPIAYLAQLRWPFRRPVSTPSTAKASS
jgi:sterol desaturase/sphingolipid hydroxylase (fatty acid hydroxylase superfamily)